jgi:CelD/BcsL family acetyltransferase involved in cellulose biosynthesis
MSLVLESAKLQVTCCSDFEELQGLSQVWNRLAAQTPNAQFFQTFDWFEAYWRHYGIGQELHTLVVRQQDEIVGIVPLVIRSEKRRVGKVRVLTFPLDDWGSFFGPVTANLALIMPDVVAFLSTDRKRWDILSWRWLASEMPTEMDIKAAMSGGGLKVHDSVRQTVALIDLPKTWDDYLMSRGSKFRNNMKRWERRVNESGKLRFEKFRSTTQCSDQPADLRFDLYDICVDIANRSWQGSSVTGTTLSHPEVSGFLRTAHGAATRLGAVDLNLLYLNEQPVAFEYGYCWHGNKFSLRFGFDKDVCDAGVGNLMWLKTIQASIEAGDYCFDMGPGSLDYKKFYATRNVDCTTLDYFRSLAPKAQLIAWNRLWEAWRSGQ